MSFILINFFPFPITRLCSLLVHNHNQAWRILNQTDSIKVKDKNQNFKERRATIILPFPHKLKNVFSWER